MVNITPSEFDSIRDSWNEPSLSKASKEFGEATTEMLKREMGPIGSDIEFRGHLPFHPSRIPKDWIFLDEYIVLDPTHRLYIIPEEWHAQEKFRKEAGKKLVSPTPAARDFRSNKAADKKQDDVSSGSASKGTGRWIDSIARFWRKLLSSDSGERGSYDRKETVRGSYIRRGTVPNDIR